MKRTILLMFRSLSRSTYLGRSALLMLIFAASAVQAQVTIKGKVSDENASGMPGVNVLVKGTTTGTTTDVNGDFTIDAPSADGVLVFSFIGYETQEQAIGGRTTFDISLMPSIESLSEVVVVGYGVQNKRDITGAITKVNSEVLMQTASHSALDQLKGNAAGVTITSNSSVPGGGSQIRIRGNRTMVANTQPSNVTGNTFSNEANNADQADAPLIVVDGIPYNGNLNDISPNDIASMEILKDASATAIYGSRGAGGVILITTKKGTSGKLVFSYDGYYGSSKVMDELRVFNGEEFAQFKADAAQGHSTSPGTQPYALTAQEQAALDAGVSTNWQKQVYQSAPMTNHNLSVYGGTDATKFSLSAGYFKQGGIIPNQDYTRYTIRSSMDHQLHKRIKLGLTTINTLSYQNTPAGSNLPNTLMRLSPLAESDALVLTQSSDQWYNPNTIEDKDEAVLASTRRLRTFNSLYAEVDIISGLKYRINVGLDFYQDQVDNYTGPGTILMGVGATQADSRASIRNTENYQYTIENLLLYDRTFNEKHKIGFTGLYSFQKNHAQSSFVQAQGIPFNYMQNRNIFQGTGVNAGTATDNYFWERGLESLMARVTYSYDGRYSLTATVRRDGASVLSPGSQHYTYPAFGAGWNISNEDFMAGVAFISNLKLRAGWGITASQGGINPYGTLGQLGSTATNFGPTAAGFQAAYLVTDLPNSSLKWQSTSQYNFGLDFGVLGNRITGAIEVYGQETKDILLPVLLPPSGGAPNTVLNLGKTKGHGMEITINSVNVKTTSGLVWTTDFNYYFNREEIVELSTPNQKMDIQNGWFVGHPISVIYDYEKLGIWQTDDPGLATQTSPVQQPGDIKLRDIDGDNRITPDLDRKVVGNFQPDFEWGMTNTVKFKRFDFSIGVYARVGSEIVVPYLSSEAGGANFTGYNWFMQGRNNQLKVDYWTPTNPTNKFPQPDALAVPQFSSVLSYVDGSFIKCRQITLGYDIAPTVLSKISVTSLRVYVSAVNPFVIWAPFVDEGYGPDPEGNGFGGGIRAQGSTEGGTIGRQITVNANNPATKSFIFGLNLKF
ncbi:MAG TPA: TonB-dependent receptor [Ohtaekwangia sp.]